MSRPPEKQGQAEAAAFHIFMRTSNTPVIPLPPRTKPYTLDEVANELNCDRSHVYHLVQAGQLEAENIAIPAPHPKKARACWRVWPEALEAFRAARRTKTK